MSDAVALALLTHRIVLPIHNYFRLMAEQNASDFHLASGHPPLFRIAAIMTRASDEILSAEKVHALVWEIMPDRNRQEWEQFHDTDFAYEIPGLARFRCNVFVDRDGVAAVFRLIPAKLRSFRELGLPGWSGNCVSCARALCS